MNASTSPAGDLSTADGGLSDALSSGSGPTGAVVLVVAAVVLVVEVDVLVVVDVPRVVVVVVVVVVVSVPIAAGVFETVGGPAWPQAGAPAPSAIPANAINAARATRGLGTGFSPSIGGQRTVAGRCAGVAAS